MDNLGLDISKGLSLNITKDYTSLQNIIMGLGWDANVNGRAWDLDAFAIVLDAKGNLLETVSYMNRIGVGISLDKDNLTGEGDGADENIFVSLPKIKSNAQKIGFFANIFSAGDRDFSKVKNAFISMTNADTNQVIATYRLNEQGAGFNAFHFADLEKINGEWVFTAVGQGTNGSVKQVAKAFSNNSVHDTKEKQSNKGFFSRLFK